MVIMTETIQQPDQFGYYPQSDPLTGETLDPVNDANNSSNDEYNKVYQDAQTDTPDLIPMEDIDLDQMFKEDAPQTEAEETWADALKKLYEKTGMGKKAKDYAQTFTDAIEQWTKPADSGPPVADLIATEPSDVIEEAAEQTQEETAEDAKETKKAKQKETQQNFETLETLTFKMKAVKTRLMKQMGLTQNTTAKAALQKQTAQLTTRLQQLKEKGEQKAQSLQKSAAEGFKMAQKSAGDALRNLGLKGVASKFTQMYQKATAGKDQSALTQKQKDAQKAEHGNKAVASEQKEYDPAKARRDVGNHRKLPPPGEGETADELIGRLRKEAQQQKAEGQTKKANDAPEATQKETVAQASLKQVKESADKLVAAGKMSPEKAKEATDATAARMQAGAEAVYDAEGKQLDLGTVIARVQENVEDQGERGERAAEVLYATGKLLAGHAQQGLRALTARVYGTETDNDANQSTTVDNVARADQTPQTREEKQKGFWQLTADGPSLIIAAWGFDFQPGVKKAMGYASHWSEGDHKDDNNRPLTAARAQAVAFGTGEVKA